MAEEEKIVIYSIECVSQSDAGQRMPLYGVYLSS